MKTPGVVWQALAWAMLAAGAWLAVDYARRPGPVVEAPAVGAAGKR